MAHAHATHMPARLGSTAPSRRRSKVVRRRRILVLAMGVLVLVLAVLANYGPLRSYVDAQARLERAQAGVVELSEQKAELQAELGKLAQADYVESLARQDLSYTRPGEELYIVTGTESGLLSPGYTGEGEVTQGSSTETGGMIPSGSPGFLERVLAPILD